MQESVPGRAEFRAFRALTTRWSDNDVYGHVNNVLYYAYIDSAVNAYLIEATGTDIRRLPAIGIVAESSCRFLAPLSFPETIDAGLALEKLGRSSVIYRVGLFGAGAAAPAALGRFVHVYIDAATRAVVPVPAAIRAAVEKLKLP